MARALSALGPLMALVLALGCGEDVPLGSLSGDGGGGGDASAGLDAGRDAGAPDAGYDAGPPRPIGAGCTEDWQCAGADAVCLVLEVQLLARALRYDFSNGGYCTRPCDDGMCPAGSLCTPDSLVQRYCVDTCVTSADCREADNYTCQDVGAAEDVCVPPAG